MVAVFIKTLTGNVRRDSPFPGAEGALKLQAVAITPRKQSVKIAQLSAIAIKQREPVTQRQAGGDIKKVTMFT
jgi:hypothetical protein